MKHGVLVLNVPPGASSWKQFRIDLANDATNRFRLRSAKHGDIFGDAYPEWSHGAALESCAFKRTDVTVGETTAKASGRLYWLDLLYLGEDPYQPGDSVAITYLALDGKQKLAAHLERRVETLEAVAYLATHDFSEPVRKIAMFTQMAVRRAETNNWTLTEQEIGWLKDVVIGGADQLQRLISDLYKLTKVELGSTESVNLNEMVEGALDLLNGTLEEKKPNIIVDKLPTVRASQAIRQVFYNLLSNAIKYQKPNTKPVIIITAQKTEEHEEKFWTIEVSDNGIGFDSKQAKDIFLAGYRLHGVSSPYWGSGIGLAVVRTLVEHHGGKIWAESKPNEGSSFFFTIPR